MVSPPAVNRELQVRILFGEPYQDIAHVSRALGIEGGVVARCANQHTPQKEGGDI